MRVGLLEDDVAIQEMLALVLQDEGYNISIFSDAQSCLNALGVIGETPAPVLVDLMIIDLRLNGSISGSEVIQQIRNHPSLATLPIILTTAASLYDIDELQNLQVALLEKPFSVDDMVALIAEMTRPASSR